MPVLLRPDRFDKRLDGSAGKEMPVLIAGPTPVAVPRAMAHWPDAVIMSRSARPSPFTSNGTPMPRGQGTPELIAGPSVKSAWLRR